MDMAILARRVAGRVPLLTYPLIPVSKAVDRARKFGMHDRVEENIRQFCTPEQQQDARYMRRLRRDIWYSVVRYNCAPVEYFLYGFSRLNHVGRQAFVNDWEKRALVRRITDENPERELFYGKYNTYLAYRKYYHRTMILVDDKSPEEEFLAFVRAHPRFVVKPYFDGGGIGVHFEDVNDTPPAQLLQRLREEGPVVLEEPIVQDEQLACFHPGSVNTLRLATAVKDGQAYLLFAFLKLGQGDSMVDNGAAGGVCCFIDMDTGLVTGPGKTENGGVFLFHPDSGLPIPGLRIPRWEEAKAMALELALVSPTQRYVGWDMALTADGWVLVEGNRGGTFLITQMLTHQGLREQVSRYLDL